MWLLRAATTPNYNCSVAAGLLEKCIRHYTKKERKSPGLKRFSHLSAVHSSASQSGPASETTSSLTFVLLRHLSSRSHLIKVTSAARLIRLLTPEVKVFVRFTRPLTELSAACRPVLSILHCPPHSGVELRVDGERSSKGRGGQDSCKRRLDPGAGSDLGEELMALVLLAVTQSARLLGGFDPAGGTFNAALLPLVVQNLVQHWKTRKMVH